MLTEQTGVPQNQPMGERLREELEGLIRDYEVGPLSLRQLMDEVGVYPDTPVSDLSPAEASDLIAAIRAEFE
jgi:hypothetical protein